METAGLDVTVNLEVADAELVSNGQLQVTADVLLPGGDSLLKDLPMKLQKVRNKGLFK